MSTQNSEPEKTLLGTLLHYLLVTIVLFFCTYLWNTFFASSSVPTTIAPTQNVSTVQKVTPKYKYTRIADIKVGERVVVSTDDTPQPTAVDFATWKKVTLYAEETWCDGTVDSINVVTLVSSEWIALHDAQVGNFVPIPLDVQEMGLDENLLAKVQAIERCPEIRAGPGRVVLTTVNHLSRGVCNLTYINSAGQNETIRPTSSHRFYSLDRKDWIHIGDARFGEKLQGLGNDIITVISCQPLGKTERVYNMTVEDEHVYYVGYLNLLAHNLGCLTYNGKDGWISPQKLKYTLDENPRTIHLLKHTPGGNHDINDTVFDLKDDAEVFALLDEAWANHGFGERQASGDIGFTVNMGRVIGTRGEKKIFMVVDMNLVDGPYQVRTAFPVQ